MKFKLSLLFCLISGLFWAQDSLNWNFVYEQKLSPGANWTVDHFEQLYLTDKDQLQKFNADGKLIFEQSLKKYGQLTEIDAKNPMKVMLFSEQQQVVLYVDNTLTIQQAAIDLSEFDLNSVSHVASSIQPDKFWVYDPENSKIYLLASKKSQSVRIENTAGLLNLSNVSRIFEQNEKLFVIDSQQGIFLFDLFGTLINQLDQKDFLWVEVNASYLYMLREKSLDIINLETMNLRSIPLPVQGVTKFKITQKAVFLEADSKIYKYIIELF